MSCGLVGEFRFFQGGMQMFRLGRLVLCVGVCLLAGGVASATIVTFTAADVKNSMLAAGAPLDDASYQWGLWAVRARPVVTGGSFTFTQATTSQPGWGVDAPSSYSWHTYGTNCVWFYDESGSEAWRASNPLYIIMSAPEANFQSYCFDGVGNYVGAWSPGGGGTLYASGYNGGVGGTNIVTAVNDASTFTFEFTLDPGAVWDGQVEFLVDGSKYTLGSYTSPGVWVEDFFGDYGSGGGLLGNMGNGYVLVPEPLSCLLFSSSVALAFLRKRRF